MSSLLFAELAATCNALGFGDGLKYVIDPQCEEAVKDLIRYLRRDDENHEIRRYLGEAKIVQTDLIPILKGHWENKELFDLVLRLLVNVTYPALVLYNAELPEDKTSRFYYMQIISGLQTYKEAFVDEVVWAVLCRKLGELLNIEWTDRSEEEGKVIERILTLMRNVLQVPVDAEAEKRPDNDATIHDQVLWALYQSGIVGLLHYIISSKHEDRFHMHVLEIISQMLRDQNPSNLALAEAKRSIEEKTRDEAELLAIRQHEAQQRHIKNEKYSGLRETRGEKPRIKNFLGARFAGTYVLKDVKSISSNDMIYHKPLTSLTALNLNLDKKLVKKPKNKCPPAETVVERRSTLSVRLFLKEFCVEFLNGAYNTLMYSVKETIHHGKNQINDESYYLWAIKFFMEFNRHYKAEMKLVSETMSLQTFHFIQNQIESYQERKIADKKKIFLWTRRMHLALKAYHELLLTLTTMDRSSDSLVRESARVIKSNIFYVVEYRELIFFILVNFNEAHFSRSFLKDLVETVHTFMKLLEQFCTRSRGIIVQEKKKARHRKQKKAKENVTNPVTVDREETWSSIAPEISAVIESQSTIPDGVVPFDSTSDVPIDDQKIDAVKRIQLALQKREYDLALGLLRASREVWPENDSFGAPNPAPEEEAIALKDIFLADLGQTLVVPVNSTNQNAEENDGNEEEDDDNDGDDHGDREMHADLSERTFQFMDFAKRFCNPRVVQACGILLRRFDQNTMYTNHCVLKLLHRIAWDCKLPSMIFQASIFRTFQRILESTNPQHKELKKFSVFIIRKFVEVVKNNSKVYIELLFWKSSKEAYEVEAGYGSYQAESHSSKQAWGEEEEDELRRLYEEYMDLPEKPTQEDMVDWILRNLISDHRTRRGVTKKLKEMGYVVVAKKSRKSVSTMPLVEWSTDEEEQLTALYQKFKDAHDPIGCILNHLTVRRPKPRIVEKLLAMGLVRDKKELRKKRTSKKNIINEHSQDSKVETDAEDSSSLADSDSDSDARSTPVQKKSQSFDRNSSKKKVVVSKFCHDEASRLVKQIYAAGMNEALNWLAESLEDIVEDAEDDAEDSTPLLPLTEACIVAMDSVLFQKLLRSLGINPPADEQEMYWRVPGNLTAAELRDRKNIILNSNSEEFFNTEDFDQHISDECRKIISDNEKALEHHLETTAGENGNLETSTLSSVLPDQSFISTQTENDINSSSEEENASELMTYCDSRKNQLSGNSIKNSRKKGKLKVVLDSSSDSETELPRLKETDDNLKEGNSKRFLDSGSESEDLKAKKHCRLIISDDED